MADVITEESSPQDQITIDDLLSTQDMVGEWIRFADAKAAVVLTVAGAIASMLIPTLKPPPIEWTGGMAEMVLPWTSFVLFAIWMVSLALACFWAFRCINPFLDRGRHPAVGTCNHFHPAAIAREYTIEKQDEFVSDFKALGKEGFRKEVLVGLLIDSHISSEKYNRVTRAIRFLGLSVALGLVYGFLIQFR